MNWRYTPIILAPAGGSGLSLRPKPMMPVTERRPCMHASTCVLARMFLTL